MFELSNWRNPETLLLNITNSALGIAAVALILWICGEAIHEYLILSKRPTIKH